MPDNISISFQEYLEHLGLGASLAVSVFALLSLGLRLRQTPGRRMHLWAMVAFFTVNALDMLDSLAYSSAFFGTAALYQWQDILIPGFVISLYFFVRGSTSSNPMLRSLDWIHVVPFVAAFLCLLPSLVLPGKVRCGQVPSSLPPEYQQLVTVGETAFWILWIVVLILHGTQCVRRLIRHKRNIRDVFSDIEGKTLR